jgi:cell wall assembly regulator SMI1
VQWRGEIAIVTKAQRDEDQMTAKEVVENGRQESFKDAKGNAYQLRLNPGLSQTQIDEIEEQLAAPLPNEIRELLAFTSGFRFQPFGEVGFAAKEMFGLEEIIPLGFTIATDGSGNDWVVDIRRGTGEWGPVLFMSHDPPVAVIQSPDLARFIEQVFDLGRPERKSQLDSVSKTATSRIWSADPYILDLGASRVSSDPALAEFSKQLPETFRLADLRALEIGSGFAWGRNGPNAAIKRYGSELIFGVEAKRSFLSRLLKRTS